MDELPYRAVVDLQPTLSKLPDQPAQGEISAPDPPRYPRRMLARNRFRLVTAHLARRDAAGLALPPCPAYRRAYADPELPGRLIARQPASLDCRNYSLAKIL